MTAKLKSSAFAGGKVGVHGNRFGIEGGLFHSRNKLEVQNVLGVPFPNHGENVTFIVGDLIVYPVRRSRFGGVFRPYVLFGAGAALSSVDLDNIGDQDNFSRPLGNVGIGSKFRLGGDTGPVQLEVLFRNAYMFGKAPIESISWRVVSFGVVYTQYRGLTPAP